MNFLKKHGFSWMLIFFGFLACFFIVALVYTATQHASAEKLAQESKTCQAPLSKWAVSFKYFSGSFGSSVVCQKPHPKHPHLPENVLEVQNQLIKEEKESLVIIAVFPL